MVSETDCINIQNLFIFGEIETTTASEVISQITETDFEQENIKELHIYICSEGGFLSYCFAIIDMIRKIKKEHNITIYTYGLGEISSAGFFLFLLGDVRQLLPNCRIFVHEHITVDPEPQTYSDRLKADRTTEKLLYKSYFDYTKNQLGISDKKVKKLLAKNAWLTKKDIEKYNIVGDN